MTQDSAQPLATHTEHHPQVTRTFSLYPDRVVVHAHWRLKGEHRSVVKLDSLKPQPRTLNIRNKWYRYAGWILAAGLMVVAIAVYNANGQLVGPLPYIGFTIAAAGIILMLRTRRPIIFARFDTIEGKNGLDIACTSRDRESFDRFVQAVTRQIRKSR